MEDAERRLDVDSERRASGELTPPLVAWALIAAVPVIFALLTWAPSGERTAVQGLMRFLAIPVLAAELVVVALAAGSRPFQSVRTAPAWMKAALGLLVAIALANTALVTPSPVHAVIRTTMWLIHLAFALAVAGLLASSAPDVRRKLWRFVVLGLCAYVGILALFVLAIDDPAGFDWKYFGLGVVHVRQLGFYSLVGAAAALGLAGGQSGRAYWLSVIAASLMLGLSFWSGTRGSPVALIAALCLGAVLLPALRTLKLLAAVVLSSAGGLLLSLIYLPPVHFFGLVRMSQSMTGASVEEVGSGRLSMWREALAAVGERPIFGHGEAPMGLLIDNPEALNHPHNVVLQVMLQWGAAGALCFFALGAALCWRALRGIGPKGAEAAPAFLVAASLLVMALYEGSFYHPYPIMMIAVSMAFLLTSGPRGAR